MSLKAVFTEGVDAITVNGLHQWDYGQKLEIHSSGLPTLVEVHFACVGMEEAIVRACEVTADEAEVTIPDKCLEQTTPITAWVFEINGSTGTTTKKIILPIEARPRPSVGEDIPEEISNQYTDLINAINSAVSKISAGDVKVEKAEQATKDGNGNNIASTYAAKKALTEGTITVKKAEQATKDGNGKNIADTYAPKSELTDGTITVKRAELATKIGSIFTKYYIASGSTEYSITLEANKTYLIRFNSSNTTAHSVILCTSEYVTSSTDISYSSMSSHYERGSGGEYIHYYAMYRGGKLSIRNVTAVDIRPYGGNIYIREI